MAAQKFSLASSTMPSGLNSIIAIERLTAANLARSEEHTSELQSHRDLHSFPTRRSSDLAVAHGGAKVFVGVEHDAFGAELDHRHRTTDRRQLGVGLGQCTVEAFDLQQVSLVM